MPVQAGEGFDADADAGFHRSGGEGGGGDGRGGNEFIWRGGGVVDGKRRAKGRHLGPGAGRARMAGQGEVLAQQRGKGGFTVGLGGFAIDLAAGHLGVGRPVFAACKGRDGRLKGRPVKVEEVRHDVLLPGALLPDGFYH